MRSICENSSRARPQVVRPSRPARGAPTAALLMAALLLAGCTGTNDGDAAGGTGYHPIVSFSDVHGIAINPEDPEELYVATHHGLIRGARDGNWSRVGEGRDDLMGFTMHPTNGSTFWVSGHPASGGNMGVRQSTDGGFTWHTLGLEGVDFHAMTVSRANPDHLWGFFAGRVYRSTDGGSQWSIIDESPPVATTLAAHPSDPESLYAAGPQGIFESRDGGASWRKRVDRPAAGFGVRSADGAWFAAFGPGLSRSLDAGATWRDLPLDTGSGLVGYLAFQHDEQDLLYAATYQAGVHKSTDGGQSWRVVKTPER